LCGAPHHSIISPSDAFIMHRVRIVSQPDQHGSE
jgi:hypothetical protein